MAAYQTAGGAHGAIAATAERAYGRLTPAQARIARHILLRLIAPGEGTPDTRRPVGREELDAYPDREQIALVVERLACARLLTVDEQTVELAHEALITHWPRLRDWIREDRERLRHHRALNDAARTWQELDRDPGALYRACPGDRAAGPAARRTPG